MKMLFRTARKIKECTPDQLDEAMEHGRLTTADSPVDLGLRLVWDDNFHNWSPPLSPGQVEAWVGQGRMESKTIRIAPLERVRREAREHAVTMRSSHHIVIPVNPLNADLLLATMDGDHDGTLGTEAFRQRVMRAIRREERVYQMRIRLRTDHFTQGYRPSSAVLHWRRLEARHDLEAGFSHQLAMRGVLTGCDFNGELFVVLDNRYREWSRCGVEPLLHATPDGFLFPNL